MEYCRIDAPEIQRILEDASDTKGRLGFKRFTEIALYHPTIGYYRSNNPRVGRDQSSDFYTSVEIRNAFPAIVLEASLSLLEAARIDPNEATWFDIGAEPGKTLFEGEKTPFKAAETIGIGDSISLEGPCVVFSNELFDAQPFSSAIYRDGAWQERCVQIGDAGIRIAETPPFSPEVIELIPTLPSPASEGYIIDLPVGSRTLIDNIVSQPWFGAFLAFDYGKSWQAMATDTPQGTARAYRNHRQSNNLLEAIGSQDLTCHICWDWLEESLQTAGFELIDLRSQESFTLNRAPRFVEHAFRQGNATMGALKQLIHPTLMGQKFQALSAVRQREKSD